MQFVVESSGKQTVVHSARELHRRLIRIRRAASVSHSLVRRRRTIRRNCVRGNVGECRPGRGSRLAELRLMYVRGRTDGRTDDDGRSAALILTEIEGGQAAGADRAALHNFNCF